MREILFRGKRIDNGEWVEGAYMPHYYSTRYGKVAAIFTNDDVLCKTHRYPVDPSTVGQYTGINDRNGKRIFEGDRCRVTRTCILAYGSIEFANGCFWFSDDGEGGKLRLCDIAINGFTIEVLEGGNGDGR